MQRRTFVKGLAGVGLGLTIKTVKADTLARDIAKEIYLTIDDGPSKHTAEIVDVLDSYNWKATFFLIGEYIKYHRDTVIDLLNRGHKIGNHSYTHPQFSKKSFERIQREVRKTNDLIMDILAISNQNENQKKLFRYPYGDQVRSSIRTDFTNYLISLNYDPTPVFWDLDTFDRRPDRSVSSVANTIVSSKKEDIILTHDRRKVLEALKSIPREIEEQTIVSTPLFIEGSSVELLDELCL